MYCRTVEGDRRVVRRFFCISYRTGGFSLLCDSSSSWTIADVRGSVAAIVNRAICQVTTGNSTYRHDLVAGKSSLMLCGNRNGIRNSSTLEISLFSELNFRWDVNFHQVIAPCTEIFIHEETLCKNVYNN